MTSAAAATTVVDTLPVPPFRVNGDRVLILPEKPPEEERSRGGIIMPKTRKSSDWRVGRVIKIGPGMLCFDGHFWSQLGELKRGDRVIYSHMGERRITIEDVEYVSVHEENVMLPIGDDVVVGL